MTSALFTIDGTEVPCAVASTAGATVTCVLTDLTGAVVVQWAIEAASEDTTFPTLTTSGALGQTATFTMPAMPTHGRGLSFLVACTVIDGSGVAQTMRGIAGLAAPNGLLLVCYGETEDRRPEGWAYELNRAIAGAGWGRAVTMTDATYNPTVGYCNAGVVIYGGAASGGQVITLPDSTDLEVNTAVLVVAKNAAVSGSNTVEVQGTEADVALETVGSSVAYLWDGTAWQLLSGGTGGTPTSVTWASVTSKPDVVAFDDATDGTVPNGTGAGTGVWTATPKISKVQFTNASRETSIPTTTTIRCAGNALESYGPERLQSSISPVVSYSGADSRAETGYRVFVHCYEATGATAPSAQTIDFDLTNLTVAYTYQPEVAITAFRMMAIASFYADGGGAGEVVHFESHGIQYNNATAGPGATATTSVAHGAFAGTPSDVFAWSSPSEGILRLTFTPPSADNVTLALRLEVLGTKGQGPSSGT
jgi:hypothetical protein